MKRCFLLLGCLALGGFAMAQEPMNLDMANKIRHQAFHESKVMDTLTELTEDIGPRLSGSPQKAAANQWAVEKFKDWGLAKVHLEAFEDFGRGWEFSHSMVQEVQPRKASLAALPQAWSPGTQGTVEGEAMLAAIEDEDDFKEFKEEHEGKLAGKILLLDEARAYKRSDQPATDRYDSSELAALHKFDIPDGKSRFKGWIKKYMDYKALQKKMKTFFVEEGVLATIHMSSRDDGILRVTGSGSRKAEDPVGVPSLVMGSEHYNGLVRALEDDKTVQLKLNVAAHFTSDEDLAGHNVIAELPGKGRQRKQVVMLGAHLDSWHTATGASDNGAGVAVMMEAMRILKAVGAKPNRTIRVALWGGEEQGLIGSHAYVKKHFATYPEPTDPEQKKLPEWAREPTGDLIKKPGYQRLAAYFNLDNGSGRIRGIYAQENVAVMPVFKQWLKPFHDVDATDVVSGNTGSTDHKSFDRVGLPGFQFIQDWLDYFPHVHHTNLDTLDHVEPKDLQQAAAVVAWFALQAANRPQKLPRKPLLED